MDEKLGGVEAVCHLAGVNRSETEERLLENVLLAQTLTRSLDRIGSQPHIVYANSIQAGNDTPFGRAKEAAARHLVAWGERTGAPISDLRLPNLFGEHGRPHYNSVVATFSYLLARDGTPEIHEDRIIPLLHVQDAVDYMLAILERRLGGVSSPQGTPIKVSALLEKLIGFRDLYTTGDIPDITNRFDRALFNCYRSFLFPEHYPIYPPVRSDQRGDLFECVRSHGGQSQSFCSSTHPGATRGGHYHLRKVERFLVIHGEATIALRRLFSDSVVRFDVTGDRPSVVDIPTMWTHSIANRGTDELITLFWADEVTRGGSSDTYPEPVEPQRQLA